MLGFFPGSRSDLSSPLLSCDAGPSLVTLACWARSLSSGCCSPRPVRAMPCVSLCLLMPVFLAMHQSGCHQTCSNIRDMRLGMQPVQAAIGTGRFPLAALTRVFWNGRKSAVVILALRKGYRHESNSSCIGYGTSADRHLGARAD